MPRVTSSTHYERHQFLRIAWLNFPKLYALLLLQHQWQVYEFYKPSIELTKDELTAHIEELNKIKPALVHQVGKHVHLLQTVFEMISQELGANPEDWHRTLGDIIQRVNPSGVSTTVSTGESLYTIRGRSRRRSYDWGRIKIIVMGLLDETPLGAIIRITMLRNFLYLNERSLNSYLSVFEDGTRGEVKATIKNSSSKGGSLKMAMISGKIDKGTQVAESSSREDTPSARFDRLRSFALDSEDRTNWLVVDDDPDELLQQVSRGTMIEVQCETYIPDTIKAMSSIGSVSELFEQIDGIRSLAPSLNLDTSNLPDSNQLKVIKGFNGLSFDTTIIGEVDGSSNWRLKAKLQEDCVQGDVEGNVTVVGKVIETWPSKHWKPLLEMSGVNVIPREQRRAMERTQPSDDQVNNWLEGPAMTIELLAIYV